MDPNNARTYTRATLLATLEKEGNGLSVASLRKAISLGLIPRPRLVSAGRGKIRSEYSETALAHARILARLVHSGKSFQDFKNQVESLSVKRLADALDFIEHAIQLHGPELDPVAKHAQVALQAALKANCNSKPEVTAWLTSLLDEVAKISSMPTHSQGRSWSTWIARTRGTLEERNAELRSSTKAFMPDQQQ